MLILNKVVRLNKKMLFLGDCIICNVYVRKNVGIFWVSKFNF